MSTLAATAFLMGLAGGPHCAAMCGAACAGVVRAGRGSPAVHAWTFQAGRMLGYSLAGGAAALAGQSLAWLAQHTSALRPAWTLMHLAVLGWGLMLLLLARQPGWLDGAGRTVWARVRPLVGGRGGVFSAGLLWAFMPCGLLYSALLVASLTGGVLDGALAMALFASGSSLGLWFAPRLYGWLREAGNRLRNDLGTRLAGAVLAGVSVWALWADTLDRVARWCASAL